MSQTVSVEVHASQLGEQRRIWGGTGWRTIHRVVSGIERDPDYMDVEIGTIKAGGKTCHVWRREGSTWTTNKMRATRYATLKQKANE